MIVELGEKLRQARLEAGLSQRQLCGEQISRNMLSLIENGSAKPSMDTLQYLAARLSKPMSYFLDDQAITSPNQAAMDAARKSYTRHEYLDSLEALKQYCAPDGVFDAERWFLEALCCLQLAQLALKEQKRDYAAHLLEKAAAAGKQTSYYTTALERKRLLLLYQARPEQAAQLAAAMPREPEWTLLYAQAQTDPVRRGAILDADPADTPQWYYLRATAWQQQAQYAKAAVCYQKAVPMDPRLVYSCLEECYRLLEDYKQAYFYACKLREQ